MTDQPTVRELQQAKSEAEAQALEIEASLKKINSRLDSQEAKILTIHSGPNRAEAMKTQARLMNEQRSAEQRLAQMKRALSGMNDQIQEAISREGAVRSKAERERDITSRRERAKFFERAASQVDELEVTIAETLSAGQHPAFLPKALMAFYGQAAVVAAWLRSAAESEREEIVRIESKLES